MHSSASSTAAAYCFLLIRTIALLENSAWVAAVSIAFEYSTSASSQRFALKARFPLSFTSSTSRALSSSLSGLALKTSECIALISSVLILLRARSQPPRITRSST